MVVQQLGLVNIGLSASGAIKEASTSLALGIRETLMPLGHLSVERASTHFVLFLSVCAAQNSLFFCKPLVAVLQYPA
jgi:hypothetical protein